MKFTVDHDYHIHSNISLCSGDEKQTSERILQHAADHKLKTICLTNHFWDEKVESDLIDFYKVQNFEHISKALPLPQAEGVEFLFGCEADMDKCFTLGVSKERFEKFDFVVVATTHMHMSGFTIPDEAYSIESRAKLWVERLDALLDMDLPFKKIGLAHLAAWLMTASTNEDRLKLLSIIPQSELERVFARVAKAGAGIELNRDDMYFTDEDADALLRIFRVAKAQGCKFYLGSDAHHPNELDSSIEVFERAIRFLELTEDDKFHIGR